VHQAAQGHPTHIIFKKLQYNLFAFFNESLIED